MINKHCDLIYCNSLKQSKAKQSKANAKLYLLTNNYFKFLFQFQKYFLDLFAILNNKAVLTPCVNNPDTALKGLKPLVIRIFRILFCVDCHAFIKARPRCAPHGDDKKCTVITSDSEVIHIHKFVNFLNNKAVLTPCVNNSKKSTQWAEATLLSKFFTFDNLSRSNPCFVINNFIHKEDIHMRISKKILTIILSIGLLFLISCGDRPTGSTTTIPSEYNGKYYVYQDSQIKWLHIKDGNLYQNEDATSATTKPEFTEEHKVPINGSGNTYYYTTEEGKIEFKFYSDYATEIWSYGNINYRYELVP